MRFGDFSKNISKPLDRKVLYSELLISDKLNSYLADINEQAEEMFYRLVKQVAEKEGVTEALKVENQIPIVFLHLL